MRGTLLAALAAVLTATASPAPAAAPAYTVWEVYALRPSSLTEVPVRLDGEIRPEEVLAIASLEPDGNGYATARFSFDVYGRDSRWRTYGWDAPVPPPACPGAGLCGQGSQPYEIHQTVMVPAPRGHRHLIVVPSRVRVRRWTGRWNVRRTTLRLQTVRPAGATGLVTGAGTVERFTRAAAKGGTYGSTVFAHVPCDAGSWELRDGTSPAAGTPACVGSGYDEALVSTTTRNAAWTLSGDAVGQPHLPYRLIVLDHPRRS